jgi:hypothetical protein
MQDFAARQLEAEFTKTTLVTIQAAAEDFKRSAQALVGAIGVMAGRSPEAEMLGAQIAPLAAGIDPAVQQFSRDLLGYISDMQRGGRARVKISGVKPAPAPAPTPRPDGKPSGTKYQTPPGYRPPHPGF